MIIPLIIIPVKTDFSINSTFDRISTTTGQIIKAEAKIHNTSTLFTFQNILIAIFIIVSLILLIRFTVNILKLLRLIVKRKKVGYHKLSLVLIEEKTLPYSFFKYIFVNRTEFEDGKIEKELLIHEEAHCLQYHSIDIIVIELFNIVLWFNPVIWLFRNSILLNHEFLADNRVLAHKDPLYYQQFLANIILRNNSNYLVSTFKYSYIKSRLIMINKSNPLHNAILRKTLAISLFLIMAITLTFSQETKKRDTLNYDSTWWYPILKLHNFEPRAFNTFDPVFEMGTTNSIDGKIVTLKNAMILIKSDSSHYIIIKSPLVHHDLDKSIIEANKGTIEKFSNMKDKNPTESISFKSLNYQVKDGKYSVKEVKAYIKTKPDQ